MDLFNRDPHLKNDFKWQWQRQCSTLEAKKDYCGDKKILWSKKNVEGGGIKNKSFREVIISVILKMYTKKYFLFFFTYLFVPKSITLPD